jgi:predicted DsbA family dithiol-disulfide isomerase
MNTLFSIAEQHNLPTDILRELIKNGEAMAALCRDVELRDEYKVEGSPTFILNEGRQKLYGNIGYKIIEANVQEVLYQPENQATWC